MTEIIKKQMDLIYEGDPWYGNSIQSVLGSVDTDLVFKRPSPAVHNIAELTAHMLSLRKFAESRLNNDLENPPEQEETFKWRNFSTDSQKVWPVMLDEFRINHENLIRLLSRHPDSILQQQVEGKDYNFKYLLSGILQHDLYHLGQIVYIHRILSSKVISTMGFFPYRHEVYSFENLARSKWRTLFEAGKW